MIILILFCSFLGMKCVIFSSLFSAFLNGTINAQDTLEAKLAEWQKSLESDSFKERESVAGNISNWLQTYPEQQEALLEKLLDVRKVSTLPETKYRSKLLLKEILLKRKLSLGYGHCDFLSSIRTKTIDGQPLQVLLVHEVRINTSARAAGLKSGDAIFSIDNKVFTEELPRGTNPPSEYLMSKNQ